jgi:chaperone modulatory protein CbpM
MIRDRELVEMIGLLRADALERWVALGWIVPRESEEGAAFDEADVARVQLICDLVYDLEIGEESVPVILSLIDQLHDARRTLRAMAAAVGEQPEVVRRQVAEHARNVLERPRG